MSETRYTDLSLKLEEVPDAIVFAIKTLAEGSLKSDQSIMDLVSMMVERITKLQTAVIAMDLRISLLQEELRALVGINELNHKH